MSFLEKNVAEFEVEIKGFVTQPIYAQINAKTRDLSVIKNALKIVDEIYPQKFGPHGTHYYSFSQREHFLNLLLRYFDRNTTLPDPVGLQKLQIICNKKAYYQRDADLIGKKTNQLFRVSQICIRSGIGSFCPFAYCKQFKRSLTKLLLKTGRLISQFKNKLNLKSKSFMD